jgi:hypothetical protein
VSFSLTVGDVTERVDVTSEAPPVETGNGEISRMLSGAAVRNVALAGRNPYLMLGLLPGVAARDGYFLGQNRSISFSTGGLQVNGQRKDTNFLTFDGVSNTRAKDGQVNNILGLDFIEEVNIQTTHYAPEYGRTLGAQINFVSRRGTTAFHGTAYEFMMRDSWQAKQFITGAKPPLRYNDFGWTLGGPLYVPGKWNSQKSKAFFFVGQEFRRSGAFNFKQAVVPTALEKRGDFSQSATKPVDPLTGQPFPNDIVPESRISAFGRAVQKVFPDPNFSGPGGNYYSGRSQPVNMRDFIIRLDYNLKPNWQLSGRYLHGIQDKTSPYDGTGNNLPLFDVNSSRSGNNFVLALTTGISSTTVNEFSFGYDDYRETLAVLGDGARRSTYGFTFPEFIPGNRLGRIPNVNISGLTSFSGSGNPTFSRTPTFTLRDNFSRTFSSHTLKVGFYLESLNLNDLTAANDNGTFSFNASSSNPRNTRNALANALLGYFDDYSEQSEPVQVPYHDRIFETFVQDRWRIRPNLTIEYGLRYAIMPPWRSQWNNVSAIMLSAYDRARAPLVNPGGSLVPDSGDPLNGVVIPGSGFPEKAKGRFPQTSDASLNRLFRGKPDGFVPTRYTNFQPRFSFAWDPFSDGKTSLRGGAGIFHGLWGINNSGFYLGGSPPFIQQASISNGLTDNPASGLLSSTQFPISMGALPEEAKISSVTSYSLGIQRQLPWGMVLDTGYVGSFGRHLLQARQVNYISPAVFAANQGVDTRRFLPYYGLGAFNVVEPTGTSLYNSLQVGLNRRMSDGLLFGVAYTLAKNIGFGNEGIGGLPQDPTNLRAERSELEESRRHYFVANVTYDLPFFRTQPGVLGRMAGGWRLSTVFVANTGRLFGPSLTNGPRQVAARPDLIRDPNLPHGQRNPDRWFDTEAFVRPRDFTYGNAGKYILVGPGMINLDVFLFKDIKTWETVKLQYRAECFNAPNHPSYTSINTQLGNRAFGQVELSGYTTPRTVQMGLKLLW